MSPTYPPLLALPDAPLRLDAIECWQTPSGQNVVLVRSGDQVGLGPGNSRLEDLLSLLNRRVAPVFLGRDARDLPRLITDVYLWQSNYKYAGMPFWHAVAVVEFAILDLLGRVTGHLVAQLLGELLRREVRLYVSRFARDTDADAEVEQMRTAAATTGCRAVKFKVGGRMQDSAAQRARDLRLIETARHRLGTEITVYMDANGSFDAHAAIELGRAMQHHGIALFEEPCVWDDYDATRQVADALILPVSGGEQDSSWPRWQWMLDHHAVDVIQPDVFYTGGLIRTLALARDAAARNIPVTPHNPRDGFDAVPTMHLLAVAPLIGDFHECREAANTDGTLRLQGDVGWGTRPDLTGARRLS